ncbi:hypothetical protein COU60_05320 [Candidatus Pacearchaeota archaeon CG10_big_fil_rev_8_21_14_0_10_34_76]|nr:MAG: hypothetical protein COU60_05320 [Candidatus Pacearchaeota archaeon CG10_big_fil_rev_8_21_14_0_10_34_76]
MRKSVINFLFVIGMLIGIFGVYLIYATSDNNYVGFSPQGNLDSSDGIYVVPGGVDHSEGCKAPIYLSENFPPSEVEPPLPPPNPRFYQPPKYICGDFAYDFCEATEDIEEISECMILSFDTHAINLIKFTDENGKRWVCVVEPQPDIDKKYPHYCMSEEEWYDLDWEDWVVETLCEEYYDFSEEKCDFKPLLVPSCEKIVGKKCSPPGEYSYCVGDNGWYGGTRPIQCRCYGSECEYVELDEH